jgi:hypothetical protein
MEAMHFGENACARRLNHRLQHWPHLFSRARGRNRRGLCLRVSSAITRVGSSAACQSFLPACQVRRALAVQSLPRRVFLKPAHNRCGTLRVNCDRCSVRIQLCFCSRQTDAI